MTVSERLTQGLFVTIMFFACELLFYVHLKAQVKLFIAGNVIKS